MARLRVVGGAADNDRAIAQAFHRYNDRRRRAVDVFVSGIATGQVDENATTTAACG